MTWIAYKIAGFTKNNLVQNPWPEEVDDSNEYNDEVERNDDGDGGDEENEESS